MKQELLQLGELPQDGPTWEYANKPLLYSWVDVIGGKPGGNYLDADGVRNGSNHHAKITITSATFKTQSGEATVDVTRLVTKLLEENTGIFVHRLQGAIPPKISGRNTAKPPMLTINTSAGKFDLPPVLDCWIATSDNRTLGHLTPPNANSFTLTGEDSTIYALQPPIFLKFDLTGVTGTLISSTLKIDFGWIYVFPTVVAIDYVDMPALVTDPSVQLGGVESGIAAGADILWTAAWDSEAAIKNSGWWYISPNYPGSKIAMEPQIVDWPKFGMKALRFSSASPTFHPEIRSSILTWRKSVGALEAYVRYMIKMDPDVSVGMNEVGVKLPGFEGSGFSARMDHMKYSAVNKAHRFGFNWYGADNPFNVPGRGTFTVGGVLDTDKQLPNCALRTGRIYTIEQRIKMNTIRPVVVGTDAYNNTIYETDADGAIEIWVDGVKVFSRKNYVVNNTELIPKIVDFFANFYHGGVATPLSQMHYEFGGVVVAAKYIGVAPRLLGETEMADINTVIAKQLAALDEAYAVKGIPNPGAGQGDSAQQITDLKSQVTALTAKIAASKVALDAVIAKDITEDAAETAALNAARTALN